MATKATEAQFDELHRLVAESLIEQINAWKERRLVEPGRVHDSEDEEQYVIVFPPALMAQAIKFMKDNGIDQPAKAGNRVDTLREAMPDFDDSNVVKLRR